jgi:hypothetical protein
MALGSTQPLTEMDTRNFLGGKKRPARRADNFAAIYEPNVWKLWEPQPLATLRASTACTGKTLPLPYYLSTTEDIANDSALTHFYRQKGDCCTISQAVYDAVTQVSPFTGETWISKLCELTSSRGTELSLTSLSLMHYAVDKILYITPLNQKKMFSVFNSFIAQKNVSSEKLYIYATSQSFIQLTQFYFGLI